MTAAGTNVNDGDCDGQLSRYFSCFGFERSIMINIALNSDMLSSTCEFIPGNSYYFISKCIARQH